MTWDPGGGPVNLVFGVDRMPVSHRWPDDEPEPVHQLLEGGYCPTCSGCCLIGFGQPMRHPDPGQWRIIVNG